MLVLLVILSTDEYQSISLMSRINEIRYVSWYETCKCTCKCRLDAGVCNNKQRWNNNS